MDVNVTIVDQKDPNNQTILGNRLVSSDQGAYRKDLSERVSRAGLKRPWRLTGHVIPLHGSCNFGVGFKELGVGFMMAAVRPDESPSFVGAPMTYTPKISAIETPATFRTDRMTEMQMPFDPTTQTVSIAVDGRILISGYNGRREFVSQGVGLGFSVKQSKTAEGIFGDVNFVMDLLREIAFSSAKNSLNNQQHPVLAFDGEMLNLDIEAGDQRTFATATGRVGAFRLR